LSLSNAEIVEWIDSFDKDTKAIKHDLLQMCWFMRGSITYDDAMMMCYDDREIVNKIIKSNLDTTKTSGLPFF
jgi:hypothetical protein